MIAINATVICLAYILGLLITGFPGTIAKVPSAAIVMLISGVAVAFLIRRVWRTAPKPWLWLAAGLVGFGAVLHFQIRLPQPSATDICHWVPAQVALADRSPRCEPFQTAAINQVKGIVATTPRLTRSDRLQFELTATQLLQDPAFQPVTGTVYVTVPRSAGTQLYPGLTVTIAGSLYTPKPAVNPAGFDFAKYLAQQGIFTGLNGTSVQYPTGERPAPSLFWSIRQRIVQTQGFGLGDPEGALVSAMVMGKTAVDLPYEIQDQFKQTGLAHALAASGAQVSLLVGMILALTKRLSGSVRLGLGTGILILYLGLTGAEPSVLRAGVMGFVALFALTADRKVKPLGSLLLAATVLLVINPLWIWDLGFQLSFLATLGLLITVPVLTQWLDWMPSAIAPLFAVPIAAYLWTLPLMLGVFGVVSPYSILINILVSPLITIISIGGMISAVVALLHPLAGSALAWTLYYPAHLFIKIAAMGSQLPGSIFAVGTIDAVQVGLLYGLIVLVWRWQRTQRYWWLAAFVGIGLVAVPVGLTSVNVSQVTVLATSGKPVLVVQDKGKVGLIHSGNAKDAQFTVLPFLQQQGINQLNWAIAPSLNVDEMAAWQQIITVKSIQLFYSSPGVNSNHAADTADAAQSYKALLNQTKTQQGIALPLSIGQRMQFGAATAAQISSKPDILQMQIEHQTWLWMNGVPAAKRQIDLAQRLASADVLVWSGKQLAPQLLERVNPKVAVVFGDSVDPITQQWFSQHHVRVHSLAQDGAAQWTPQGFAGLPLEETN